MKTIRLSCLRLVPLLVGISGGVASAGLPPESQPAELRTDFHPQPFGKLDGHGKLLYQEIYQNDYPADWHSTSVYYPRGGKESVKLSRDVSAINGFFTAELRRPQTVRTFLKQYLVFFLRTTLGDDPVIITVGAVEERGLGSDPRSLDPQCKKPETIRLRNKIRPYISSPDDIVKGNAWTVDMNVLTNEGAVEHWLAKGTVSPLRIESFLCEPKEPHGTFLPYVRTR